MSEKKKAVSIMVPSKEPKKGDGKDGAGGDGNKDKEVITLDGVGGAGGDADKKKKKKAKGGKDILEPEELSEEDKALKEGLELAVTRVDDSEPGIGEFVVVVSMGFSAVRTSCNCCLARVTPPPLQNHNQTPCFLPGRSRPPALSRG